ncbi:membrane metallo-endopeptidase-like 1 [Ornithodoros turicata]|uniref:membrane metallo-endopeptidase-like 1 n=1 Tax=Ornithodoros turicata TaxID=34597 RepID=UPI00313A27A8
MQEPSRTSDGILCIIIGLSVSVVVASIIIIAYVKKDGRLAKPPMLEPIQRAEELRKIACSSVTCTNASKRLLMSVSHKMQPCNNFYKFICDGWQRAHLSRLYQRSVLSEAENEVKKKLMLAMETSSIPRTNQTQIHKLIALYRSCTSSHYPQGDSVKSIARFLRGHNQNWPDLSVPEAAQLFDYVMELDIRWHLNIVYRYKLEKDKAGRLVVQLFPHKPPAFGEKLLPVYESLVRKVANMIGGKANYDDVVNAVINLEAQLNALPLDKGHVAIPWVKISATFPGTTYQIWIEAFRKYHPEGKRIRGTDTVVIHNPRYFKVLMLLLFSNMENGTAAWFVNWRFISSIGCQTSYEFKHFEETQVLWPTGHCEIGDVHTYCRSLVQNVMTPQWKGLITKVLLTSDAVFDVLDITKRIKSVVKEKIRHAAWMDSTTRARAFTKMETLKEHLPKFFVFDGKTSSYERYTRLPDLTPSFVDNWLALRGALGEVVDNITLGAPLEFNVRYHKLSNALHVNVDIVADPVYTFGVPAAMNYAGLGALVAREYTRAFDWGGSRIDGVGEVDDWWSNITTENYKLIGLCFATQLHKLIANVTDVLGLLPDAIAESSGLRLAYFAHMAAVLDMGKIETLSAVDNMSNLQLFFAAYCFRLCENDQLPLQRESRRMDERSSGEILCNIAVMNMLEFAETFECSARDVMNSDLRCRIW